MLIEFRVANHRSLRDEQVLTLEAGRVGDPDDPRPRRVAGHKTPLLPVTALYGPNASGKSNVLSALELMRDAVLESHRLWQPDGGVPHDPFAWGPKRLDVSLFEVELLLNGTRFRYGFTTSGRSFDEEWLYAWPRGRRQTWFSRTVDQGGDAPRNHFEFGDSLEGENRLIEQVTRPNALFLSVAAQHNHAQLAPIYQWFHFVLSPVATGHSRKPRPHWTERWLQQTVEDRAADPTQRSMFELDLVRNLLRGADVGIVDVKLDENEEDGLRGSQPQMLVRHESSADEAWLPLEEESHGTRKLVVLVPYLVGALSLGGLLVVDELEASLHPLLAAQLLHQFNDPRTNPRNAQLLFTTHDTTLLGNVIGGLPLRRDQIWLTEKDAEGATVLYPLTDYKPRKSENLERGYLQGRYGAIPFPGELVATAA